ncbi:MAG: rod shape-determining protein RodA [Kiritimatiellae bacterium]|jgi:rod shape determining protein RodA|nr:rod shape-determining protein RodA [Kiritimatiellia bacterium]
MKWFKKILSKIKRMSLPLSIIVLIILITGIFFIYSACYISEDLPVKGLYKKQIVWSVAGIAAYMFFALNDYRKFRKYSWLFYFGSIVCLLLVLFAGVRIGGARRWFSVPVVGILIQPSEIAKMATMVLMGSILSQPHTYIEKGWTFFKVLMIAFFPIGLIMLEPDLSSAIILLPVALSMMFVSNLPLKYIFGIVGIGVVFVLIVLSVLLLPDKLGVSEQGQEKFLNTVGLRLYHKHRIMVFLNLDEDPMGTGWNKRQSQIAVGSGGTFGKGFLNGTQNILGYLPRTVAPTDFIYSVIAEEKGFLGSIVVLSLYAGIFLLSLQVAYLTWDRFGRLLCVGFTTLLFCHVFINISMTVGIMPVTGLPLPLLSYGGTIMLISMSELGIIQSVYVHSRKRRRSYLS